MNEKTLVRILDKDYEIESDIEPLLVQSLGKYVEEKYQASQISTTTRPPYEIAILTALNIAHELFSLKDEYEKAQVLIEKLKK